MTETALGARPADPPAGAAAPLAPATSATPEARVRLSRLSVRDFRNFARLDLEIPPEGVVVIGENGQGKTNLLEAVYYLQLLRSMRGARDQDLVRFGADGFHVSAEVHTGRGRQIAAGFERAGRGAARKRVRLDGAAPPRLSDALGALPSVIWSPQDVQLVAGSPSERRRFLDVALALTSRRYLAALQVYRAALARRNAALREVARTGRGAERVGVWEPALAQHGATLWLARVAWVEAAAAEFARLCASIGERGTAALRYHTALAPAGRSAAEVEGALAEALAAHRASDVRRGLTHAGPHRDDLVLTLAGPDGVPRDLRTYGSAGQQRTAAIALRMLEAATLRDRAGGAPLFLLDDPFAELDVGRAHRILELLGAAGLGQTILVVPRHADVPTELSRLERWGVRAGHVSAPA